MKDSTSRVVVTNKAFAETIATLKEAGLDVIANDSDLPWTREEVIAKSRAAEALIAFMPDSIDREFLDNCPSLRIIACALKGYDNFDVKACAEKDICVTIVQDLLTEPTAELAIGLMIALGRNMLPADELVRSGAFHGWRPILYGKGLDASSVGILGGGAVGRAIAHKLSGFGCSTAVFDQRGGGNLPPNAHWSPLDALVTGSDFLVNALPLTPSTLHFVNAALLTRVRPGCLLVNPSRGSVIDEQAVADALRSGQLGGYAADVYEMEDWARADRPLRIDPGLLALRDRTIFTAHLGSAVEQVRRKIELEAAANVIDWCQGRSPRGAVSYRTRS